jgi:hypothetical protein
VQAFTGKEGVAWQRPTRLVIPLMQDILSVDFKYNQAMAPYHSGLTAHKFHQVLKDISTHRRQFCELVFNHSYPKAKRATK